MSEFHVSKCKFFYKSNNGGKCSNATVSTQKVLLIMHRLAQGHWPLVSISSVTYEAELLQFHIRFIIKASQLLLGNLKSGHKHQCFSSNKLLFGTKTLYFIRSCSIIQTEDLQFHGTCSFHFCVCSTQKVLHVLFSCVTNISISGCKQVYLLIENTCYNCKLD